MSIILNKLVAFQPPVPPNEFLESTGVEVIGQVVQHDAPGPSHVPVQMSEIPIIPESTVHQFAVPLTLDQILLESQDTPYDIAQYSDDQEYPEDEEYVRIRDILREHTHAPHYIQSCSPPPLYLTRGHLREQLVLDQGVGAVSGATPRPLEPVR